MDRMQMAAQERVARWHLGQTSQRYESAGLGAGVISTGKNDHGGVSYGSYQLSSSQGTVQEYLAQSKYGPAFAGLTPATVAFNDKWREIARTDAEFGQDQHAFIGRSHYRAQLERLEARGLDLSDRGRAVQDCIWSTSVQFRNLTPGIFQKGLDEKFGRGFDLARLSDRDIVEAVQDYKYTHNATLFSKSPALHPGLLRRARHERQDLVELADAERLVQRPLDREVARNERTGGPPRAENGMPAPRTSEVERAQTQLANLGYTGADGHLVESDGRIGPNTRHAVRQYQRDHQLPVNGRLDTATRARLAADDLTLASSTHPGHVLYRQSLDGVLELDRRLGVPSGSHSIALAGVVAAEAARAGLVRVDRVELGQDGRNAQAVQFTMGVDLWATNRTSDAIDVSRAVNQPLDVSSQQAAQALRTPRVDGPALPEPELQRARGM